jgi:ribonuclease P protein subunit RPR2
VRHHHERWDGTGYPDRLQGEEIPLGARVFAVADTLDAITSDRPYRKARSWEYARADILDEAGRQFDPEVVQAFQEAEPRLRAIALEFTAA